MGFAVSAGKCLTCKTEIWMEQEVYNVYLQTCAAFHCVHGHTQHFVRGESEETKLRRERDSLKQQQARLYERISEEQKRTEHEKRRANGYKGHATRITKRAKAGVCPCCNRTFKQLAQHMANKHPEFTPMSLEDRPPEGATVQ